MTTRPDNSVGPPPHARQTYPWCAIQGACLLLFGAGFLAEQTGWIRFDSKVYAALLAVMGAAWVLEAVVDCPASWTRYRKWRHLLVPPLVVLVGFCMTGEPDNSARLKVGMVVGILLTVAYVAEE